MGTSLLIIPELCVLVLTKRHVGSGNEIETTPSHCKLMADGMQWLSKSDYSIYISILVEFYLTIRLRARVFYEQIVSEARSRVDYRS